MRAWTVIGVGLLCCPLFVWAEEVTELRNEGDGSYSMKIEGKEYLAMSVQDALQLHEDHSSLKQRLAEANEKLAKYTAVTNQYEDLRGKYVTLSGEYNTLAQDSIDLSGRYSQTADKLVLLNQGYSSLVVEYDDLVEKYRDVALRTSPREPLDVGLGAVTSNNSTHGVVMVGAGTRVLNLGLRAWVFGGKETYGAMIGASF